MNFTQIKMIICDMDGTLLDNQKNLPPHFNQIYKECDFIWKTDGRIEKVF